eukprot:COSAG05_NODE_1406_length_4967_cov_7.938180_2_plen_242_part_00
MPPLVTPLAVLLVLAPAVAPASEDVCQGDTAPPARTVTELNLKIKEHEDALARLHEERRRSLRLARAAGSADAYGAMALPEGLAAETDRMLEPAAWFELGARISAVSTLPPAVAPPGLLNSSNQYFVLGDAGGKLHFYGCPTKVLLPEPYNTGHTAAITAIGLGHRDSSSLLVTAAADGSVRIHNFTPPVTRWARGRAAAARRRATRQSEGADAAAPVTPSDSTPMQVMRICHALHHRLAV